MRVELGIDHPSTNERPARAELDTLNQIHPDTTQHHATTHRHRSAGNPGTSATRHNRQTGGHS